MNEQLLSTVFKINGGYCHILPERIALLKLDTIPENAILPSKPGPTPRKYYVIFILALILIGLGIYGYFKDFIFESCVIAICGISLYLYSYSKLILSTVYVIERDRIDKIRFRHGVPGRTASRFIVLFRDDKNRLQERLIVLTNRLDYGDENSKLAIAIMNRHFEIKEY
jgi:hypothetical protein